MVFTCVYRLPQLSIFPVDFLFHQFWEVTGKDVDTENAKVGEDILSPSLLVEVLFLSTTLIGLV